MRYAMVMIISGVNIVIQPDVRLAPGVADGDTKAKKTYLDALSAWRKQIDPMSVKKTDCVGKTIDEFHKGEPGYKPVCP